MLADLEAHGLLAAPHTSAGRMPTENGLRLFVDGMMQVAEPTREERATIEQRLNEPGPIEHALEATSTLLSDITGAAGMVMVPQHEARLRQLSLVSLAPDRALAVLVGEDGHVENRIVELSSRVDASTLEQASNYISARVAGKTLAEANLRANSGVNVIGLWERGEFLLASPIGLLLILRSLLRSIEYMGNR